MNYGICCLGNRNTSGGRAIMSLADVDVVSPGTRAFDIHSVARFATIPDLSCSSPERPIAKRIIDLSLLVSQDDQVQVERATLGYGRPSKLYNEGRDYELRVVDRSGKVVWRHAFDIFFEYDGPRYLGVDYSDLRYSSFPVQLRIPYTASMQKLELSRQGATIFSADLEFCNQNEVCDPTETHESCPSDCPLEAKDGICTPSRDGVCDPDCAVGADPDCEGKCGNHVCNAGESYESCPEDCPSGGADGLCDVVEDRRCDPDCLEEKDPDCGTACGDGDCASCANDPQACEDFSSCPADCPSGGEDHFCDGKADGICDPDCERGQDPDCRRDLGKAWWILLLVLLLVLILSWILKRGRRA